MRVKTLQQIHKATQWHIQSGTCLAHKYQWNGLGIKLSLIYKEYDKVLAHQNKLDRRKICKAYRKKNKNRKDLLRKKERVLRLYDTKEMGDPFWHSRSRIDRLRAYYKHYRGHKDLSDWGHGGID